MKNKLFVWVFGVCFLIGCSKSNERMVALNLKFDDFEQNSKLNGKKFRYDSVLNPRKILIKKDKIIVSTDGSDNLIHLINKEDMSYMLSKGERGEGPGQISSMVWEFDRGIDENTFWAYDLNNKAFHQFDLKNSNRSALKSIRQREDWFLGFSVNLIESNRFISNVTMDSYKFGIFDSLGNRVDSFGPWSEEKLVDEKTGSFLLGLNQGQIEFNSKNQVLAHARVRFELLEISNLKSGKVIGIYGPENYDVTYDVFDSNGFPKAAIDHTIPNGYSDVFVGDKSIFAIYVGKTNSMISSSGETSRTIFQFSLEGKPLSNFTTNYPIKSLAVDENSRKIYAVTEDKEPGIAIFGYD